MEQTASSHRLRRRRQFIVCLTVLAATWWTAAYPRAADPAGVGVTAFPSRLVTAAMGELLDPRFTLPVRERKVRVAKALTVDIDADGDTDAIAATQTGKILVWINVGDNRLERRKPVKSLPGQSRLGRSTAPGVQLMGFDVGDNRWGLSPELRPSVLSPTSSSTLSPLADRPTAQPLFSLTSRGPPARPSSTL